MSTRWLRAPAAFSSKDKIGVDRNEKVVNGFAVITKGEAKGHDIWCDKTFLKQIADAGNAAEQGIKSRYTHPGLSGDGMGNQLGRARSFKLDDDIVRADLHFYQKVDGPRAERIEDVLNLAEEDPDAFGASIVFCMDLDAMDQFEKKHTNKDKNRFVSPDPENSRNLPHARLAKLRACDVVDEPAANEGFLSDNEELASRAETLLDWVFGLRETEPDEMVTGNIPAQKIRAFVTEYLDRHQLSVSPLKQTEPTSVTITFQNAPLAETVLSLADSELDQDAFGRFIEAVSDAGWCAANAARNRAVFTRLQTENMAMAITQAAHQAMREADFRAISYRSAHPNGTPLAPKDEAWNGPKEVAAAEVDDLKVMCSWVDSENDDLKTAYKLPHHKQDGKACVWRGVANAAARLPQTKMPDEDRPGCRSHLGRHYKEFDEEPPWQRDPAGWELYSAACAYLLKRGDVHEEELELLLRVFGFSAEADAIGEQFADSLFQGTIQLPEVPVLHAEPDWKFTIKDEEVFQVDPAEIVAAIKAGTSRAFDAARGRVC